MSSLIINGNPNFRPAASLAESEVIKSKFIQVFVQGSNRDVAAEISSFLEGTDLMALAQTCRDAGDIVRDSRRRDTAHLRNSKLLPSTITIEQAWKETSELMSWVSSDDQGTRLRGVPYHCMRLETVLSHQEMCKKTFSTIVFWKKVVEHPAFDEHRNRLQSGIERISKLPALKRGAACDRFMGRFFTRNPTVAPRVEKLDLHDASLYQISPDLLRHFPNLGTIDLKGNHISHLPLRTFRHNPSIQKVYIHSMKPILYGALLGATAGFFEGRGGTMYTLAGGCLGAVAGLISIVRKVETTTGAAIRETGLLIQLALAEGAAVGAVAVGAVGAVAAGVGALGALAGGGAGLGPAATAGLGAAAGLGAVAATAGVGVGEVVGVVVALRDAGRFIEQGIAEREAIRTG